MGEVILIRQMVLTSLGIQDWCVAQLTPRSTGTCKLGSNFE